VYFGCFLVSQRLIRGFNTGSWRNRRARQQSNAKTKSTATGGAQGRTGTNGPGANAIPNGAPDTKAGDRDASFDRALSMPSRSIRRRSEKCRFSQRSIAESPQIRKSPGPIPLCGVMIERKFGGLSSESLDAPQPGGNAAGFPYGSHNWVGINRGRGAGSGPD